jgi:hypothetical protein
VVVREGFSRDLAGALLADLEAAEFSAHPPAQPKGAAPAFAH